MLTRFHVENFRCLRAVDVPLRPLTVLIGPNDSGKSAFLEAVRRLFDPQPRFAAEDVWRREDKEVHLRGEFTDVTSSEF